MFKTVDRLRIIFLIIFAVACAAVWAHQILYVWPAKECEEQGKWFAPKFRKCARVVYLPSYTKTYREMQARGGLPTPPTSADPAPGSQPPAAK
jgi:hypothetical protein